MSSVSVVVINCGPWLRSSNVFIVLVEGSMHREFMSDWCLVRLAISIAFDYLVRASLHPPYPDFNHSDSLSLMRTVAEVLVKTTCVT